MTPSVTEAELLTVPLVGVSNVSIGKVIEAEFNFRACVLRLPRTAIATATSPL